MSKFPTCYCFGMHIALTDDDSPFVMTLKLEKRWDRVINITLKVNNPP